MPKKKLALKKPVKIAAEPYWNYFQVQHYLEEKYGIELRNYKPKKKPKEGQPKTFDFWSMLVDDYDIHNDTYVDLAIEEWLEVEDDYEHYGDGNPLVLKEIAQLFLDEFGEDEMHCWVSW